MRPVAPRHRLAALCGVAFVLAASPALAHPGHGASGFAVGLAHPLGGADHLLAMVAVGLWAGARGGRAGLAWPLTSVSAVAVGGVLPAVLG